MKTSRATTAQRAGRVLGRAWREALRQEARAARWMIGKGLPPAVAKGLPWLVTLAVTVALFYVAFWLALLLISIAVAAWVVRNSDGEDHHAPEWREGHSGFGLYDKDDWRIDMHSDDDT